VVGPSRGARARLLWENAQSRVRGHCYLFRIFGQWLERRGMALVDLDDGVITSFWRKERRQASMLNVRAVPRWV
jgi:hypothetical protein